MRGNTNYDFPPISGFISEMIHDSAIVTIEHILVKLVCYRTVPFSMMLNDPQPTFQGHANRHYLTLNISETIRDIEILIGTYARPT